MAKELPYFKFVVADWLTGNIVFEPFNVQGLFINICAIYWQRNGILMIEDINKRFKNPIELAELSDRFFSVRDGFISIAFLDEQLKEREFLSSKNAINGSKGGAAKANKNAETLATASDRLAKHSNKEKKRKEKKRKEDVFFDERLKLHFTISGEERIYGNEHQRGQGGLSEMAIKEHCKNEGISYAEFVL